MKINTLKYNKILEKFNAQILELSESREQYKQVSKIKHELIEECKEKDLSALPDKFLDDYQYISEVKEELKETINIQQEISYIIMLELLDNDNTLCKKVNKYLRLWEAVALISLPISAVVFTILAVKYSYWLLTGMALLPIGITFSLMQLAKYQYDINKAKYIHCIDTNTTL